MDRPYLHPGFLDKVMDAVALLDEYQKVDVISEVVGELINSKYTTDEQRVTGIIEAIAFVTKQTLIPNGE